ncbi:MAG: hypothetical protein KGL46_10120 [Hyphomicrobiales bacterium]|nr:hypothetical protein [Hyphomicrobiales bacterium]
MNRIDRLRRVLSVSQSLTRAAEARLAQTEAERAANARRRAALENCIADPDVLANALAQKLQESLPLLHRAAARLDEEAERRCAELAKSRGALKGLEKLVTRLDDASAAAASSAFLEEMGSAIGASVSRKREMR